MMGSLMAVGMTYVNRWSKAGEAARRAREVPANRIAALAIAVLYNAAGFADIASTTAGLAAGGYEANPIVRSVMEMMATYWIAPKLACQLLVTTMILWFPHRFVLSVFSVAVLLTCLAVVNNLVLAGMV